MSKGPYVPDWASALLVARSALRCQDLAMHPMRRPSDAQQAVPATRRQGHGPADGGGPGAAETGPHEAWLARRRDPRGRPGAWRCPAEICVSRIYYASLPQPALLRTLARDPCRMAWPSVKARGQAAAAGFFTSTREHAHARMREASGTLRRSKGNKPRPSLPPAAAPIPGPGLRQPHGELSFRCCAYFAVERSLGGWVGVGMGKTDNEGSIAGGKAEYLVRSERLGRPPLPWAWAIYRVGDSIACERGEHFYRSAEDAWAAGRAMLLRRRRS